MLRARLFLSHQHWRVWYAFAAYAWMLVFMLVVLTQAYEPERLGHFNTMLQMGGYFITGVVLVWLLNCLRKLPTDAAQLGLLVPHWPRMLLCVGLGLMAFYMMAHGVESASPAARSAGQRIISNEDFNQDALRNVIMALNITLLAPLGEEMMYRGLIFAGLFHGLKNGFFAPWAVHGWYRKAVFVLALVISSYLFMASHGGGAHDAQMLQLFAVGAVCAAVYAWSGSLWAAVLVHCGISARSLLIALQGLPVAPVNLLTLQAVCWAAPFLCAAILWLMAQILDAKRKWSSVSSKT